MSDWDNLIARLELAIASGQRYLLGVVGAPGVGKSSLAEKIQQHFANTAVIVPMDGFHLSNQVLEQLGLRHRKGAPETFDSWGFVQLLQRVRQQTVKDSSKDSPHTAPIYAPEYRREIEEGVAQAIRIDAATPLVIVEGNYLLLSDGVVSNAAWAQVRPLLDFVCYLEMDESARQDSLLQRHMRFGRTEAAARAWIAHTDEPNARLIEGSKVFADQVLHLR